MKARYPTAGALLMTLPVVVSQALAQPRPASDLRLAAPIATWDEALPLGNGLLGGLLWGAGNRINLSLDRGDLWDLRPAAPFGQSDYRWADIVRLVGERKEDSLHIRFDEPYDNIVYPTKLPGGRIVFTMATSQTARAFTLSLARAEASVSFDGNSMRNAIGGVTKSRDRGTERSSLRGFFSATDTVALFCIPALESAAIVRPASLGKLGYDAATFGRDSSPTERTQWMVQRAAVGLTYVVAVGERRAGALSLVAITIATNRDGVDPLALARRRLHRALAEGYDARLRAHEAWWQRYWRTSSAITVPDSALQSHLDLVQYYYGAAARRGTPPIPLQGVWTADGASLPPWKGDLHNDLNTQTTYLAAHATGAADAMQGWLDYNWKLLPTYRRFARDFYGVRGAAIPGVMALDGQPLGGWAQYSLSPTMGLWVAQSFHLHWRYTRDRRFLRERAYPFVAELGTAVASLLRPGADGRLRLPLSSSPEIFDNGMRAWLPSTSNFDLALLHWAFGALDEMGVALGDAASAKRWRAIESQLEPLVIDAGTGALPFATGLPYNESHRHFSHAMAIHPLALLTIDEPRDSITVQRTLDQLAQYGSDWWTGYSFSWYSAMLARAGRGEDALLALETYRRAFVLRNGFHANGDQTKSGLSKYQYRPVTLEGNFLALHAAQEMLLQSWGGVVRVFPAVSERWRAAAFRDLRAEGGFRVSATRAEGRTQHVRIVSTASGELRLRDPFDGAAVRWSRAAVRREGRDYIVRLRRGDVVEAFRQQ